MQGAPPPEGGGGAALVLQVYGRPVRRLAAAVTPVVLALALVVQPAVARDVICQPHGTSRATVLYFHPGGLVVGRASDPDNVEVCQEFAARGYRTRVVDFPLLDLPGAVRAAKRGAAREHARTYAVGFSSGGTLAALLAARGRVAGAATFSAPTDLLTWPSDEHAWDKFHTTRAERMAASPYYQITARITPILVMHDPQDLVVAFDQATRFVARAPRARLVRVEADVFHHTWTRAHRRYVLRWLDHRTVG
jgi:acetyl esterase/lipase